MNNKLKPRISSKPFVVTSALLGMFLLPTIICFYFMFVFPVIFSAARLKNVIRHSASTVNTPSAILFKMISVCGDRVDSRMPESLATVLPFKL